MVIKGLHRAKLATKECESAIGGGAYRWRRNIHLKGEAIEVET